MSTPPRWLLRSLWTLHRAGFAVSGGRPGLRTANGGASPAPAWWLNPQAQPETTVERDIPIVILEPIAEGADA